MHTKMNASTLMDMVLSSHQLALFDDRSMNQASAVQTLRVSPSTKPVGASPMKSAASMYSSMSCVKSPLVRTSGCFTRKAESSRYDSSNDQHDST
jgi:hypothetical protein